MWQEDYFKELSRVINLRGVKTGVTENNGLPVMLGDAVVCRINSAGQPFRVPGDLSGEATAKVFIKASSSCLRSSRVYEGHGMRLVISRCCLPSSLS